MKFLLPLSALLFVYSMAFAEIIIEPSQYAGHCNQKTVESLKFAIENAQPGEFGNITRIALADWWNKPTEGGRVIINCNDTAPVVLSFLRRHGKNALILMEELDVKFDDIEKKYGFVGQCDDRATVKSCLKTVDLLSQALEQANSENFRASEGMEFFVYSKDYFMPAVITFSDRYSVSLRLEITTTAKAVEWLKTKNILLEEKN